MRRRDFLGQPARGGGSGCRRVPRSSGKGSPPGTDHVTQCVYTTPTRTAQKTLHHAPSQATPPELTMERAWFPTSCQRSQSARRPTQPMPSRPVYFTLQKPQLKVKFQTQTCLCFDKRTLKLNQNQLYSSRDHYCIAQKVHGTILFFFFLLTPTNFITSVIEVCWAKYVIGARGCNNVSYNGCSTLTL